MEVRERLRQFVWMRGLLRQDVVIFHSYAEPYAANRICD
jgi:hypothetical protein